MARAVAQVRIERLAAGGAGVGRWPDGRVVFVPRTAPGDRAEVELRAAHRRWLEGRLVRLIEPSPLRRPPPCPFATRCGGCPLEHLPEAAQREAKRAFVADAFARLGGQRVEVPPVVASPRAWRYRNRATFVLRRGRGVVAGFRGADHPDRVVDVDGRCLLLEDPLAAAWDGLRAAWGPGAARLPAGPELRLTLRATATGEVGLLVEGGRGRGDPEPLRSAVPALRAVWGRRGGRLEPWAGAEALDERWNGESVRLRGATFLQVNRAAAAELERTVLDWAGDVRGRRVVDAYAGVALHGRRLARAGADVVAIELDADAVVAAREAAPPGLRVERARVEEALPRWLPADLVLLNPPRAGLAPAVVAALRERPPRRLLYVSCDPATLARDVGRLTGAFRLTRVQPFDLFPQTAHVETVAELVAEPCATT